jgi:hypothetical protein
VKKEDWPMMRIGGMGGLQAVWFLLCVAVWLAIIIWVAIDSGKRNISPVFWTLATVISGPLGLIGYGIVRELKQGQ